MSDKTGIEWTDATWNPTTGCDRVSPGCDHCYAMTLAPRLKAMGSARYQNDGDPATSGRGFGFTMHPDALDQPLRWSRSRLIFVNSMSDLFHSGMSIDFLADVFAVMSIATQHTFQVLTKRPGVMRSVLRDPMFKLRVNAARLKRGVSVLPDSRRADGTYAWPLQNVWLGTSVEDQKRANLRIPALLETPAAVRFLSMEPLLGPVDLTDLDVKPGQVADAISECEGHDEVGMGTGCGCPPRLDWVIVGGESGRGARPMHPEWARSLRDQCTAANVPFHFKQWGEWRPASPDAIAGGDRDFWMKPDGSPAYYANRYVPEIAHLMRVGKKLAGRELDGRTWDEYPGASR